MAYALISSVQTAPGSNGGNTGDIDTTGATLLVLVVDDYSGAGVPSGVSDNKGNTWTPRTNQAAGNAQCRIFDCKNPTVGSGHHATYFAAAYPVLSFLAFSGADTTSPFDVENGAVSGSGTSLATGSVTPSQANSLIVCACTQGSGATGEAWSSPFGANATKTDYAAGTNMGANVSYEIQTTATARNPVSSGVSTDRAAAIAVFKPAAGAAFVPWGNLATWADMEPERTRVLSY